jgi:hypothetical protein
MRVTAPLGALVRRGGRAFSVAESAENEQIWSQTQAQNRSKIEVLNSHGRVVSQFTETLPTDEKKEGFAASSLLRHRAVNSDVMAGTNLSGRSVAATLSRLFS